MVEPFIVCMTSDSQIQSCSFVMYQLRGKKSEFVISKHLSVYIKQIINNEL